MPKFSIILPVHNAADFMRKALDSIKAQTFKDYELIVVCDACTDNSVEIAREYTDRVYEVDYGCSGPPRAAGLDVATGEWVLFMDDDDWWLHEFVLQQLNDELGDEDVLCFGFIWKYRGYTAPLRPGGIYWPAVWSKCWRRSTIGETRFTEEYPDDLIFHNKMFGKLMKIKCWDMPLYYYNYWRPGSISCLNEPDLRVIRDE